MPNEVQHSRLNGVVYTPDEVAEEVVKIGLQGVSSDILRVLEPSAGDGAFLRALLSSGVVEDRITAVDVDEDAASGLEERYGGATIVTADFIEFALRPDAGTFNLIIGNPPFIKRVAYGKAFGDRVRELAAATGFPLSDLKNAWAAFVVASVHLLEVGGTLALVLPYEMIAVKYGRAVQLFLVQKGFSVEMFVPDQKAFPELEQDAIVLLARRDGKINERIQVNRVEKCSDLSVSRSATVDIIKGNEAAINLKAILLESDTIDLLHKLRGEMGTIADYCGSAPGIVTAANEYFILKDDEVEQRELEPWARRILKKGSYLPKSPVLGEEDLVRIFRTEPCNLIDFFCEGSPALSKAASQYIEACEKEGVDRRYKCRGRKPWYRIPIVDPGDGLFFKRAHILPRLCVNETRVLVTDTAYHIRMKDEWNVKDLCFSFYNSVTLLFAEIEGRFYSGGVLELTPEEFRGLPLTMLKPSDSEFESFVEGMSAFAGDPMAAVGHSDRQMRGAIGISEEQMVGVRTALRCLRVHRMRHAGE